MVKSRLAFFIFLASLLLIRCSERDSRVAENMAFAQQQYQKMITDLSNKKLYPRALNSDGSLKLVKSEDWTSGFFPGALWQLYNYTGAEFWQTQAEVFLKSLEQEKSNTSTHDIGFMMFCSYGQGYRLTGQKEYREILLTSARSLASRFDSTIGCLRSWDWNRDQWQFPVIIDNMMNLELLFWTTEQTGDSSYYAMALSHAKTTMENHFRADYSCYHLVDFDTTNGAVRKKQTWQGYSDSSTWSRGMAWGLYGYVMTYRYTKEQAFLQQAENIAKYILEHENLPLDMVPYWDFQAPQIPDAPRDASAAVIIAAALYELHIFSANDYKQQADLILQSLSNKYKSHDNNFILDHGVGNKPDNSEVDVPLIYADYYFLEANLRKKNLEEEVQ